LVIGVHQMPSVIGQTRALPGVLSFNALVQTIPCATSKPGALAWHGVNDRGCFLSTGLAFVPIAVGALGWKE